MEGDVATLNKAILSKQTSPMKTSEYKNSTVFLKTLSSPPPSIYLL
jgi:hypothetical protein